LQSAIDAAKTVNGNAAATQTEVDTAVTALNTAITAFNNTTKEPGTKVGVIGDTGQAGGIIFYVDAADTYPGWKYLEAALVDLFGYYASTTYQSISIPGTATAIGTGKTNTTTILAEDANAPAAKACADYAYGGYNDWILPSKDELNEMYTQLKQQGLGSFGNTPYWSSSENSNDSAWVQHFNNGTQEIYIKNNTLPVRAVRVF
jgi:hypothetical protein